MNEIELSEALLEGKAAETDQTLPTGRCRISVGTIKNCTSGMTERSCYQVATNVGGVADWTQGARCP
jgi:hypothetical protein